MNATGTYGLERLVRKGEELLSARRLSEALDLFQRAEARGADADRCAAGRWMIHMLLGDFELAWRESDAIRRRGAPDPHRFWQGESLRHKRVMLRCLHGFGDAVQFLRYVPRMREIAAGLIVEVPPRFRELASCIDGVEEVITWGNDARSPTPEWDVQIESNELPFVFRTQLRDLPLATNYLKIPLGRDRTRAVGAPSRDVLRVGLAWTAGEWNPKRSVPFPIMQSLLEIDGCEFWSLHGSPEVAEGESLMEGETLREDPSCRNSIRGLAVKISQLDLVITVDTLAAHLAGAMRMPAWVLLQHEADWRWLHKVDHSPWYPSLRLFRQPEEGDWKSVICVAKDALWNWSRAANRNGLVA
jgi:hypothetical protein